MFYCELLHYLLVGVYITFYLIETQGTKREKKNGVFVKKRIKKITFEHLFSFPLLPSLFVILFLYNNFE